MSLRKIQIEHPRWVAGGGRHSRKWLKKQAHRYHRRRIKASNEYVAQYNRFAGWEY
ncbi:MAG TPA: hypothetical protein VD993_11260 [Chitinophagaceae bacterium]|nr:hypothetical protein [Chitinophagaceae bacterium]